MSNRKMTSKEKTSREAMEYIANEKGIDNITGAIEYNWKLYQPCFQTIDKDLDRLEKLEKAFKIINEELDIHLVEIEGDYTIVANWCSSGVNKRKGKLLKEVLEDE